MKPHLVRICAGIFLCGFGLGACTRAETHPPPIPVIQTVLVQITATPRPTATAISTPSPSSTPTPTPTRTSTAPAIALTGDPLAALEAEPVSQNGAICGFVDYFDFPIDPPNAELGRGGGDYGVYRQRYQSNHAGEDWGYLTGENLGRPVYAIGHGMVTYAQPYGWGVDQGTVIVRHTFRNGRVLYSFYGHLDPPSVTLRTGACLARGDTVGKIGDPSGRPHLHFEIRLHNPDTPGPGYWSVDPTLAGWLPPSRTIWENRMSQQPGTVWIRFPKEGSQFVGATEEMLFVLEEGELRALNLLNGRVIWRMEVETDFPSVLISEVAGQLVLADPLGHVEAFLLPTAQMMAEWNNTKVVLNRAWEHELGVTGSPRLIPLSEGGVVVGLRQQAIAFSSVGEVLWEEARFPAVVDWQIREGHVIALTAGDMPALWWISEEGVERFAEGVGGQVVTVGDGVWVYDQAGVSRVEGDGAVERVYTFGRGRGLGQMMTLSGGDILILHPDLSETRLLRFDPRGQLLWERSFRGVLGNPLQLVETAGEVFVLVEEGQSAAVVVHLYRVDFADMLLTKVFTGGTRTAVRGGTWVVALQAEGMLLQIGGGHQVGFFPPVHAP